MKNWQGILGFCRKNNAKWFLLINEAIKLHDAECTALIKILDGSDYEVEYFEGGGSPRDIETKTAAGLKHFGRILGRTYGERKPKLMEVISKLIGFQRNFRPIIVEVQVYPYEIGMRRENTILWEWRKAI